MAKRYRVRAVKGQVTVDEQGPWVDYNDYDALAARLAEAERLLRDVIADDEASLARGDYGIANGLRLSIDAALAGTADQPSVPQAAKGKSFDQFRAECQEYARRTDPTDGAT